MMSPALILLILIVIGVVAGLLFDRIAGPGWLSRQIAGSTRTMVTSALVGIAGSFVGYHVTGLLALGTYAPLIGAVVGAAVVLWVWRMVR
jgi:uncharacterized membrane protein YeaQ/YmgE (transglycosylase-associated protein family)